MCVFFIFFTPVESNSKCIFHPHRPPLHPTNPPSNKFSILKNHMCILSLINIFSANSAQILFTLHKSNKIHHTFIYTPQIPHNAASTGG